MGESTDQSQSDAPEGVGARILVVEDEEAIRRGLCDVLAFRGHAPEGVERGDEGLERARSGEHALVLLDLMLPGLSGFDVCETLRAEGVQLPILMLTARGSEEDVLRGFRCGADDYVTKPFSVAQLMARVDALLRRATPAVETEDMDERPAGLGPWHFDFDTLALRAGDAEVPVTRRELDILCLFAREAGRIVSRRLLLREVWDYATPERVETRTVDMHIAKLRKKLDKSGVAPGGGLIETVRGEGYRAAGESA